MQGVSESWIRIKKDIVFIPECALSILGHTVCLIQNNDFESWTRLSIRASSLSVYFYDFLIRLMSWVPYYYSTFMSS